MGSHNRKPKREWKIEMTTTDSSTARPAAHYACRFAAREAVLKALGTGFSHGIGLADVSVVHDRGGRPEARLSGKAAQIAADEGDHYASYKAAVEKLRAGK